MTDDLPTLFAFDRWATSRLLDACRRVDPDRYGAEVATGWPSLRSTVAHIAAGTELWSRRFLGQPADSWVPEAELATPDLAGALLTRAHDALDGFIRDLTPDKLAGPFTYRNFKGLLATAPLWAALRHVVNHSSYHRGQAASKLRLLGVEPPLTDLVLWAIEQTFQAG